MGKDRKPLGTLAIVALAAVLLSAVALAVDVDAAQGGRGGGKGHGGPNGGGTVPTATLTVSPNPVPAGTYATVTGTGFTPGGTVNFVVDGGWVIGAAVNANGVASVSFMVYSPGTVGVAAYQYSGGSWTMVGSLTFSVV